MNYLVVDFVDIVKPSIERFKNLNVVIQYSFLSGNNYVYTVTDEVLSKMRPQSLGGESTVPVIFADLITVCLVESKGSIRFSLESDKLILYSNDYSEVLAEVFMLSDGTNVVKSGNFEVINMVKSLYGDTDKVCFLFPTSTPIADENADTAVEKDGDSDTSFESTVNEYFGEDNEAK